MPTAYGGGKMSFNRKVGKWEKVSTEKAFDYENVDPRSAALLISFFRYYPDYFFDLLRAENAPFGLELVQRVMMRINARYRNVYTTGARGITKTFVLIGGKLHQGTFYPGTKTRYFAPAQKQSALLASSTFSTLEQCYPAITGIWNRNNDRAEMFRISTSYGSEFTMYAPRGDSFSTIVGEEMAQEGENGFPFDDFENETKKGLRLERRVNNVKDRCFPQLQQCYISNAASRQNKAFAIYRATALKQMMFGEKYDGFCIDIPWQVALMCNLRSIEYYKNERATSTQEAWMREMEALYIGTDENPLINDEVLARSRRLKAVEFEHCGDTEATYIVAHDVSYADGRRNAECADVVLKLTQFTSRDKKDKFRKQAVYLDSYPPPPSAYLQAKKLKELWKKYCLDGGKPTYIVVDAQAYGTEIVEELMKPSEDGTPPLCCINHEMSALEQPGALPVIMPLKAGTYGTANADGAMIEYAQTEFERGNVELPIPNALEGVNEYKKAHGIKSDKGDRMIILPYRKGDLLCQQIANLRTRVSGLTRKEERKTRAIQRDIWSALKYALRLAQILEDALRVERYAAKSSWGAMIAEKYGENATITTAPAVMPTAPQLTSPRANLLKQRKARRS